MGPPEVPAGGFGVCASSASQPVAATLRATVVDDAGGRSPGIHRDGDRAFVWVWASYEDTLREDRVARLNEVQLKREPDGTYALCTRVEVIAPTAADGERRTYDVAARFESATPFPAAPMRVVVDWVAGCACDPIPRGNTTATFPAVTIEPESR